MQWVQPDSSLEALPSHPPLGFLGLKSLGPTFFCSSSGQGEELWRGQCGAGDCKGPVEGERARGQGPSPPHVGCVVKVFWVCPSQRESVLGYVPCKGTTPLWGRGRAVSLLPKPHVWSERSGNWRACPGARNNKLTVRKDLFLKKVEVCTMSVESGDSVRRQKLWGNGCHTRPSRW